MINSQVVVILLRVCPVANAIINCSNAVSFDLNVIWAHQMFSQLPGKLMGVCFVSGLNNTLPEFDFLC